MLQNLLHALKNAHTREQAVPIIRHCVSAGIPESKVRTVTKDSWVQSVYTPHYVRR
jgi:hypothetical protein